MGRAGDGREDVPLAALAPVGVVRHHPIHHVLRVFGIVGKAVEREQSAGGVVTHQPLAIKAHRSLLNSATSVSRSLASSGARVSLVIASAFGAAFSASC